MKKRGLAARQFGRRHQSIYPASTPTLPLGRDSGQLRSTSCIAFSVQRNWFLGHTNREFHKFHFLFRTNNSLWKLRLAETFQYRNFLGPVYQGIEVLGFLKHISHRQLIT